MVESGELRLPSSKLRGIQLVVCDMDGTALNSKKELSQETLCAWSGLRKTGIACTIASARTPMMLGVFCAQAGISDLPVITLEGALVRNWLTGEPLYECPMEPIAAEKVMEYCHSAGLDYTIYTSRCAYLRRDTRRGWRFEKYNALADRYGVEHVTTATYENHTVQEIIGEKVYKVFIENPGKVGTKRLRDFLEGIAHIRIDCSEGISMTVMHESVSKGAALQKLLPYYGLAPEQVCCFGDWYNDISMLDAFPNSVAMQNAAEEVKRAAGYVTRSNDENGVAYFINQYILDKQLADTQEICGGQIMNQR